jgi:flotillin
MLPALFAVLMAVFLITFFASRYKRCPPDMILVVYGKEGEGKLVRCLVGGGGAMIWPIIQDYAYLSLTPLALEIADEEIGPGRADGPNRFNVAISRNPEIAENAALRLLNMSPDEIAQLARDLIRGALQGHAGGFEEIRERVVLKLNEVGLDLLSYSSEAGAAQRNSFGCRPARAGLSIGRPQKGG